MIAALIAAAALGPAHVIEVPDNRTDRVTIQAVFKLPQLDPLGRAAADVISQVVVSDNDSYTKQDMRDLCIPGGQPKCYAMPDHMAIQLSVLPADLGAGMRMVAAMSSTARMDINTMNQYLTSEPYRHKSVWSLALFSDDRAWDRLRANDISDLYKRVFRPDNIILAAGGYIQQGASQLAWNDASRDWRKQIARPLRQSMPFKDFPQLYPSHVLELRGPEIMPDDKTLPAKLLALMALGSGKASNLFQDIRESKALSYRQEGALWPTADGFVPRVLVQIKPRSAQDEGKELADIRSALLDDVSKWTPVELDRVVGYATAMAWNGVAFGPFYFRPSSPLGTSLEDRTLLAAYWQMKTARAWDPQTMVDAFKTVDLDALKSEGTAMLKVAIPVMHPKLEG